MIENVNDVLSILSIVVILLFIGKICLDEFLLTHNKYIKRLEDDYYNDIEEIIDEQED